MCVRTIREGDIFDAFTVCGSLGVLACNTVDQSYCFTHIFCDTRLQYCGPMFVFYSYA